MINMDHIKLKNKYNLKTFMIIIFELSFFVFWVLIFHKLNIKKENISK
jgi:hypothetical protein